MKIISKFKDYYDFLVSKYGIDGLIIYDRTSKIETDTKIRYFLEGEWKAPHIEFPERSHLYFVAICGMLFLVYYSDGEFYFGAEAKAKMGIDLGTKGKSTPFHQNTYESISFQKDFDYPEGITTEFNPTDVNEKFGSPIIVSNSDRFLEGYMWKNINLSTLKFGRVITPERLWMTIYNWLSREKEVVDKRTDSMKAQSKGFDEKSFKNTGNRISKKKPRRNGKY